MFAIRCQRVSNIIPGKTCKHFNKNSFNSLKIKEPCSIGETCQSYRICCDIIKEVHTKISEREEKLKPFKTFQDLNSIRGSFEIKK